MENLARKYASRLPVPDRQVRMACHTSLDAAFVVDDERRYIYVNERASWLLGAPTEWIIGRRIDDFTPPEHRPDLLKLWADFERRGSQHGPYEVLRADGSRTCVTYRATRHLGPGQHLVAAREIARPGTGGGNLTPRERTVLQLAADGCSLPEIAETLVLSHSTVKTHLRNAYGKLCARGRAAAVAKALRRGLIE